MKIISIRIDVYDDDKPDSRYTASNAFSLKTLRTLHQPSPAIGDLVLDSIDKALLTLEDDATTRTI